MGGSKNVSFRGCNRLFKDSYAKRSHAKRQTKGQKVVSLLSKTLGHPRRHTATSGKVGHGKSSKWPWPQKSFPNGEVPRVFVRITKKTPGKPTVFVQGLVTLEVWSVQYHLTKHCPHDNIYNCNCITSLVARLPGYVRNMFLHPNGYTRFPNIHVLSQAITVMTTLSTRTIHWPNSEGWWKCQTDAIFKSMKRSGHS